MRSIEIIDSQVHANRICPSWETAELTTAIDALVAAMDAVGVDACITDDYTYFDFFRKMLPGYMDANGYWQSEHPFSKEAVRRYPARFAYVCRVDERAPDLRDKLEKIIATPGAFVLRITKVGNKETDQVAAGDFNTVFSLAEEFGLPVFIRVAMNPHVMAAPLAKHPKLQIIFDHCGIDLDNPLESQTNRLARLEQMLSLAKFQNLAIKWSHAERLSEEHYPFNDIFNHFRMTLDAFGPDRIMWASDTTQSRDPRIFSRPCTWAETLHYLLDRSDLTANEKSLIFGGTVRRILRWEGPTRSDFRWGKESSSITPMIP